MPSIFVRYDVHSSIRLGFSLVETVLAMAVMSLAVTVLLGLLPHGLEMSRKAGVSAGESRATSEILGELSQVDWVNLASYERETFLFDDQGVRLNGRAADQIAYVARIRLPTPTLLPGSSIPQDDLRRVVIEIASTPDSRFAFSEDQEFSTYTSILCRSH